MGLCHEPYIQQTIPYFQVEHLSLHILPFLQLVLTSRLVQLFHREIQSLYVDVL